MGQATLQESLKLLRGQSAAVAAGVLQGEYVFWLGSGISFGKMPGLGKLIYLLLKELWDRSSGPTCPYRLKFKEIIDKAPGHVRDDEDPALWKDPGLNSFLKALVPKYSEIFAGDVVVGGTPNPLVGRVFDIPPIYNDTAVKPDVEHLFVVALVRECIVSKIVTTNWDPLVERAAEDSRLGPPPVLKVIRCAEDFLSPTEGALATLVKIHGDARGCCIDSTKYSPYFIVTKLDLARWTRLPIFDGFKTETSSLLTGHPSLFVGLSVQDFNLLELIVQANANRVSFDVNRPRLAFAPRLGADETTALKATYGDHVYTTNFPLISATACISLYGKPLFGTLYLLSLFEKAKILVNRIGHPLNRDHIDLVSDALNRIESRLIGHYDNIVDHDPRWVKFCDDVLGFVSRFLKLYRIQDVLTSKYEYHSLSEMSVATLKTDANVPAFPISWLVVCIAALIRGETSGLWRIALPNNSDVRSGHFQITLKSGRLLILFFGVSCYALPPLIAKGAATGNDVAVIYPHDRVPKATHTSPARTYPGMGSASGPKEISFRDLVESSTTMDDLVQGFYQELL